MTELFGWFAAVSSAARSLPQLVRTARAPSASGGVSAAGAAFVGINALSWTFWSAPAGVLPVLFSSVTTAAGFLAVSWLLRASLPRRDRVVLAVALSGYVAVGLLFGPTGLGYAGSVGSSVQFVPQALRTLRSGDGSGVAPGTYALAAVNEIGWLVYAVLSGLPLVAAPYLLRLPVSLLLLFLLLRPRLSPRVR